MTYLLVHLVKEIDILGLVFLHNMFHSKGSWGYSRNVFVIELVQKEASPVPTELRRSFDFCVDYIGDLKPIEVSES